MFIFPQAFGAVAVPAGPDGGDPGVSARVGLAGPATTVPDNLRGEAAPRAENVRLVIEQDSQTSNFVYKTVDRTTGDVIKQYPRDQLLEIGRHLDYRVGSVFSIFS